MCGIVGIFDHGQEDWPKQPFDLELMRHRGPNDSGVWTAPGIALGHVRLSILDLSAAGHQPFVSEDGRYVLVYNGEIYNYLELREVLVAEGFSFRTGTDTEVLLTALRRWGKDALPKLWGMFAFALWDTQEETCLLARDRFGEKPLYLRRDGRRLYFASELKMLLSMLPAKPSLCPLALDRYLHHGYITEPDCLLGGIEKLPPASFLICHADAIDPPESWWRFEYSSNTSTSSPEDALDEALSSATKRCLRSDVPVGISLSGGLDSSALAVLASKHHDYELRALSVGYPGQLENDESSYARELAGQLNMPYTRILIEPTGFQTNFTRMIRAMDEPVGDTAAFAYHQIARAAREQGMPVLLSGIGGDEVFWGYDWVRQAVKLSLAKRRLESQSALTRRLTQLSGNLANLKLMRQLARNHSTPNALKQRLHRMQQQRFLHVNEPAWYPFDELQGYFLETQRETSSLYSPAMLSEVSPVTRLQAWRFENCEADELPGAILRLLYNGWLSGNCLQLGDRLSMDWSVELRLPLLESGLVDTIASLPQLKQGFQKEPKALLKKVLRRYLPSNVIDRPKRGFAPPAVAWIRQLLNRYGAELPNTCLASTGHFDTKRLEHLVEFSQKSDKHLNLIYRLIVVEVWMREVLN